MLVSLKKTLRVCAVLVCASVLAGAALIVPSREKAADLILRNGQVYTVDPARSWAEAVAVRNGRIVYVGSNAGASAFQDGNTRLVDVKGRMVLPGFIDSHNHAYLRAEALYWVNFSAGRTLDDYKAATQAFLAQHPDAQQVRGVGFNLNFVLSTAQTTGRYPKQMLDDIVGKDIPAVIITGGHHEIWVNTKAMQIAGITKDTPTPAGAVIDRDPATGEPIGILREFGAQNLVISKLPQPDFTVDEFKTAILDFQRELAPQRGVTSVLVPVHYPSPNFLDAMKALDDAGQLTARYSLELWADETRGTAQIPEFVATRRNYQGKLFKIDTIKIFATGASSTFGKVVWDPDVLNQTIAALDKEHFRVYVHVIGTTANNSTVLDAFEYALNQNKADAWDRRHTITHVSTTASPLVDRFKSLGVRADGHPVPKAFFDAGVGTTSSSDYPVRDFFPETRIRSGVLNGVPIGAMIASHTINGAVEMYEDTETGSIEVGKAADLVVLDQNLFNLAPADITTAKSVMVVFDGHDIFRDASFMSASYMSLVLQRLADNGEITSQTAALDLDDRLHTVEHFESRQDADKVVKQMQKFVQSIGDYQANSVLSESAYSVLKADADAVIALWTGAAVKSKPAAAWQGYPDDEHGHDDNDHERGHGL